MSDTTRNQINLFGLTQSQLMAFFQKLGQKSYTTKQVMQWLYHKDCVEFAQMSNFSKTLIAQLEHCANLELPKVISRHDSKDGTIKWVIELGSGNHIETVYIPQKERGTLCISSQIGCALDCSFCSTGKQGFNRNLSSAEIIGQVIVAHRYLKTVNRRLSNVVFMGMGEPLLNEACVYDACDILLDDLALGLSRRKVTVSTSGVVPAIERLSNTTPVSLAISLHAPDDALRDTLVPINQKYPINILLKACEYYLAAGEQERHVLFEYVMLKGVNDSPRQAKSLADLLLKLPKGSVKVNLIPFNKFPKTIYQTSSESVIDVFQGILHKRGIRTTTRVTRGDDIVAACGQLAGKVSDKTKRQSKQKTLIKQKTSASKMIKGKNKSKYSKKIPLENKK